MSIFKVGAALEISLRKNIFKHFLSQCKLVDMVCPMKSHQGRFQKKSFSCILPAFSRVFCSRFAGENAFLDGFHVVFTVVQPLLWLLAPPLFYRLFRALIM